MAKGTFINENVKALIAHVSEAHPGWGATKIQRGVVAQLNDPRSPFYNKYADKNWPGVSAVGTYLREIKEKVAAALPAIRALDKPWTLSESISRNIPAEATNDLLKIRLWCLVVGRTFTIREAKWVAYLRGVVPPGTLLSNAYTYAIRERACDLVKMEGSYTDDLDTRLSLSDMEESWMLYATAARMGVIPRSTNESLKALKKAYEEATSEALPYLSRSLQELEARLITEEEGRDSSWLAYPVGKAVEYRLGLKCEHSIKLLENADMMYAMWLRELSKGAKWGEMPEKAKEEVAERLHTEIAGWSEKRQEQRGDETLHWFKRMFGDPCKPSGELFRQVGLKEDSEDKQGGTP